MKNKHSRLIGSIICAIVSSYTLLSCRLSREEAIIPNTTNSGNNICAYREDQNQWDETRKEWRCPSGLHPREEPARDRIEREKIETQEMEIREVEHLTTVSQATTTTIGIESITLTSPSLQASKRTNLESTNNKGKTALHIAAGKGNKATVKMLVAAGADLKALDNKHRTALHIAAASGNLPTVKYLVKQCPLCLHMTDKEGNTPIEVASINHHTAIEVYLRSTISDDFNANKEKLQADLSRQLDGDLKESMEKLWRQLEIGSGDIPRKYLAQAWIAGWEDFVKVKNILETSATQDADLTAKTEELLRAIELELHKQLGSEVSINLETIRPYASSLVQALQALETLQEASDVKRDEREQETEKSYILKPSNGKRPEDCFVQRITIPKIEIRAIPRNNVFSFRAASVVNKMLKKKVVYIQAQFNKLEISHNITESLRKKIQTTANILQEHQQDLTALYREMKQIIKHRRADKYLYAEDEKEKEETSPEKVEEIKLTKRRWQNAKTARDLLEELQKVQQELKELLISRGEKLTDYITPGPYDYENDYSYPELETYLNSYGIKPNIEAKEQQMVQAIQKQEAEMCGALIKLLGSTVYVSKEDFKQVLLNSNLLEHVATYLALEGKTKSSNKDIANIIIHSIMSYSQDLLLHSVEIKELLAFQKKMHKLEVIIRDYVRSLPGIEDTL